MSQHVPFSRHRILELFSVGHPELHGFVALNGGSFLRISSYLHMVIFSLLWLDKARIFPLLSSNYLLVFTMCSRSRWVSRSARPYTFGIWYLHTNYYLTPGRSAEDLCASVCFHKPNDVRGFLLQVPSDDMNHVNFRSR